MKLEPKFRPVMSETMLRECYADVREGPTKEYLKKFLLKVGAGLTSPGYIPTPTHNNSVTKNLGFSELESNSGSKSYSEWNHEELYSRWQNDPLSVTSQELEVIQTYRWENDLMSAEESAEYESKLLGG